MVATGIMETELRYIAGHQFPQVQQPADATTYVNDGNLADLIERSITKLIPEIAGEAVQQINNQLPTSVPTTDTLPVYDQDIDMDVVRLQNAALSLHQTGRVPEHQWPADIIPAVQQKLLNQIKNDEFVEFNLLLPSHAPPLTQLFSRHCGQQCRGAFHFNWQSSTQGSDK